MAYPMGERQLEMGGPHLGRLTDSTEMLGDFEALRERLAEDGYLLLRGLHDRELVKAARASLLELLDFNEQVDRSRPLDEGRIAEGKRGQFPGGMKGTSRTPAVVALTEAPALMGFFTGLLGAPAMTYDYKWVRAVPTGANTGAHYDIVYMGRGTMDLYTCWTPLGDLSLDMGTLALWEGSNKLEQVKATYGKVDVDRDHLEGWFSRDPIELVERYGGRWLTSEFRMGDAMIFGMFTMHGSLNNTTNRYRLSCDTRYQRVGEPVDERWVGGDPKAHSESAGVAAQPIAAAREKWGV